MLNYYLLNYYSFILLHPSLSCIIHRSSLQATIYATQLIEDGNRIDQAIQVLGRFGADPGDEHLTLYKKIIKDFLGRSKQILSKATATQSPEILAKALRTMLYKLVNDMKSGKG